MHRVPKTGPLRWKIFNLVLEVSAIPEEHMPLVSALACMGSSGRTDFTIWIYMHWREKRKRC